jgi:hypothetical protein
MGDPPALKRPKLEKGDNDSTYCPRSASNGAGANGPPPRDDVEEDDISEEAVIALIAHRERDVERCKLKLLHYQSLVRSRPLLASPFRLGVDDRVAILVGLPMVAAAGRRGDEAGRGALAARQVPRSQAAANPVGAQATDAADPEGTQAIPAANPEGSQAIAAATREEGSIARAAAVGEPAACHPRDQQPTGPAPSAHAWLEESRCPVIVFITGAAGTVKERGEAAQEKDWYFLQIPPSLGVVLTVV